MREAKRRVEGRGWKIRCRMASDAPLSEGEAKQPAARIRSERGWSNYEDWPVTDQSDPKGDPGTSSSACLSFFRASFRKSCPPIGRRYSLSLFLSLFLFLSRADQSQPDPPGFSPRLASIQLHRGRNVETEENSIDWPINPLRLPSSSRRVSLTLGFDSE